MAELVKKRTKRDIESERKRKKIYEEGIKLFRTYGYDNTTLEDIRQASGMSRGSIYHFFSKKRDILYYFFAATSKEAMNSLVINDENLMKPARAIQDYTAVYKRQARTLRSGQRPACTTTRCACP